MFNLIKISYKEWKHDNASNMAAALTFYAVFALAPIMIILIAVAGSFFGEQAVKGEIVVRIGNLVGIEIAAAIQVIVENAHLSTSNWVFTILSALLFLFAASRIITQLKFALNKIWDVEHRKYSHIHKAIKPKFLSMFTILGLGPLFVLFLIVGAMMATFWAVLSSFLPFNANLIQVFNLILSFGITAFIIGLIYKYFPDLDLKWKDIWMGAVLTTLLFMLGNFLIGLYLRNFSIGSVYGAAGSLIIILIWLYYTAQIFLFGAEFTKTYALNKGSYSNSLAVFFKNFFKK